MDEIELLPIKPMALAEILRENAGFDVTIVFLENCDLELGGFQDDEGRLFICHVKQKG